MLKFIMSKALFVLTTIGFIAFFATYVYAGGGCSCLDSIEDKLYRAAERGDRHTVEQLLEQGANPNDFHITSATLIRTTGQWVIGVAAENGHTEVVKALYEAGAYLVPNRHSGSRSYTSVLECAMYSGKLDLIEFLVQSGDFSREELIKARQKARREGWTDIYNMISNYIEPISVADSDKKE